MNRSAPAGLHRPVALTGTPAYPVKFFAVVGMIVAAVYAEVLFRWITGPYFKVLCLFPMWVLLTRRRTKLTDVA